ncbi:S1 RNA-binding domain-containing protein [bacterium]|nr:S1 RNA-binding domain-containing protein [bacterium]
MKELLEKNSELKPLKLGQIVEGKIIERGRSKIFLDLGPFGTGVIYGKEFYNVRGELRDLKEGDKILAKVTSLDNEEGYIELSVSGATKELAWEKLKEIKEKGEIISVKIIGANKGGLLAKVSGIPAFLPVSQLSLEHYPRVEDANPEKILKHLQKFVGKNLDVKILDLSQKDEKLILSERAKETEKIKKALSNYKVGDVIKAEVTGVTDFGVFVKFGKENLEGLIHISELDWKIVKEPSAILKVGDKVKAKIIEISDDKVFLSLKALKENPWLKIEKKYKIGDIIKGKVVKFNSFGAFIEIEKGIQGLLHISEFKDVKEMEKALEVGKEYKFKILSIDSKEYKISLALVKDE